MHAHLQKVLAVALHPDTCDGEATAAFTVARRLAAKNGSADLPVAEAKIISRAGSSAGAGREGPRAGSPQQRTAWRVSIRADRLHEFLGVLIGKAGATGVALSLTTFALLGRHVHTPSWLEFDLKGPRGAVVGAGRLDSSSTWSVRDFGCAEVVRRARPPARAEKTFSVGSDFLASKEAPPRPFIIEVRSGRKKARISSARASGCSIAAKCPPRGITLQRRMSV